MNQNKYYIETYGCQMNVSDSEVVATLLKKSGYSKTDDMQSADVIFLNTCAIREKAEETVMNRLDSLHFLKRKNPNLLLGVLGCMAKNLKDVLLESRPYVDVILGPDSYRRIPEILDSRKKNNDHFVDTRLSKFEVYDSLFPSRMEGVNAWISIMRGCDKFCTFCIVPFTRGRERSRSVDSIISEVKNAVSKGFIEITLLGQNVNSYRVPEGSFAELLLEVSKVKGVQRVRYTSPHPQDMTDDVLKVMSERNNICNYIHLPLQSGADRILSRMNRTYSRKEFLQLTDRIRKYMPDCSISTDIIVGFPGETESDFNDTMSVVEKVQFNFSYMFKYSSRPGTKAAEYSDQIDESVKQNRLEKLISSQKEISLNVNKKQIGKELQVIVEKESKKSANQWSGRTAGNTWVIFDKMNFKPKDLVTLRIDDAQGVSLFGTPITS
jgi:tRNA-2-methylthio-N6-dimethylallyladenosine synthase